ncbi:MAG: fused MFS/spermidine synthase [Myxococcota bacterium]|jgi:spermidine synthase|nr:fused MFS/spermidine synthase [Myxococcota bacterium]
MKDRAFVVVALCFFLSGLAALIYETAWTREFAFVFGTSELAVATVLAAYMAGLAAGAAVGGRIASVTQRPLALYGFLELGIAIAALLVPFAISAATKVLVAMFGGQPGFESSAPLGIAIFYLAATFVIIMVPTMFMGATLPLLSRHVVTNEQEIGPRIGALYAINTAGAVAGTLIAAFVLLPALGIRQTVYVAVAVNALVFVVAIVLVRISRLETSAHTSAAKTATPRSGFHFVLPLMTLSGALSFTYEVLWVRLLSQLLGGSIYAFATMLASFLAGIAIGSAIASRQAVSAARSQSAFVICQLGIALLTTLGFGLIDFAPALARAVQTDDPLLLDIGIAVGVLLPTAVCIGATFPFAVRMVAREADDAGPASARVYTWNTVGAIVGSIGCAFVLLPELGFRGTIALGVTLNLAIALITVWQSGNRGVQLAAPVLLGCALFLLLPQDPWNILRSSPINRSAPPKTGRADFYEVGRGATVLLTHQDPAAWRMSTNGLPESVISAPKDPPVGMRPAVILGAVGALLRPEARDMLVVGLGGGVTVEDVPRNIEHIDVVELEHEVIEANRWLGSRRKRDPLSDPRITVHEGDARGSMQLTDRTFDVIAAQASHPWTGGASHLYTSEFFELVSSRLEPGGIFVQWLGTRFADIELLQSVVATLYEHFEYVHVFSGFLFVASNEPLPITPDFKRLRELDPELAKRTGLYDAEDFAIYLRLDNEASKTFSAGAPITTDDRNLLQMRSPHLVRGARETGKRREAAVLAALRELDPLPALVKAGKLDLRRLVPRLSDAKLGRRAGVVIESIEDPREREAIDLLATGALPPAERLVQLLSQLPDHERLRAGLLRRVVATGRAVRGIEWTETELIVLEAMRSLARGGNLAVAAHDDALAQVSPAHPLHSVTTSLRATWRLENGEPERLREVIEIVDHAFLVRRLPILLWTRAQAGAGLGDTTLVLASLGRIKKPKKLLDSPTTLRAIHAMLRGLDVQGQEAVWRDQLLYGRFKARRHAGDATAME